MSSRRRLYSQYPLLHSLPLFFFNDTAPTEIYTLSLHDALPICCSRPTPQPSQKIKVIDRGSDLPQQILRSEEHTSELQSRQYLVCRLLLEKKKDTHSLTPPMQFDTVTSLVARGPGPTHMFHSAG